MGIVYGLLSALAWGAADFFARLSAERVGARRTLFWMQVTGALATGALLLWPGFWPAALPWRLLALNAGIGLFNVTGGLLLYRALEIGTVSLVSPVSSTFAAIAAALAIAAGERPSAAQLAGLVLAAAGVIGAAIPPRASTPHAASRKGVGLAAGAALAWGASFFALRYVVRDLGPLFPVFVSRVVSIGALALASAALKRPLTPPRGASRLVAAVAVLDSAAFVFYDAGVASAMTAVVSILSSLFGAVTVVLALIFLRERMGRMQWAAVGVILVGVALVSSG
jgi:drug/metabolite transporter (DMT)-like permease